MIAVKPYQRERAVAYARKWALSRNPLFIDFTGFGGNCTNFVSQAVLAGSCVMNYTKDFGWYYLSVNDRAPAWSSVEYFFDFMTGNPAFSAQNGGIGPYGTEVSEKSVVPGDVIQYQNAEGVWYHSVVISEIRDGEIYVCAQSNDALDRPLSSYEFATARFLHIAGVRIPLGDDEACFRYLLNGGGTAPAEPPLPKPQNPPFEPGLIEEPPMAEPPSEADFTAENKTNNE